MKTKVLALLTAFSPFLSQAQSLPHEIFSCYRSDYATTRLRVTREEELIHLSLTSHVNIISGLTLPEGVEPQSFYIKPLRVDISFPAEACTFSGQNRTLMSCNLQKVDILESLMMGDGDEQPVISQAVTHSEWVDLATRLHTIEDSSGNISSFHSLGVTGFAGHEIGNANDGVPYSCETPH